LFGGRPVPVSKPNSIDAHTIPIPRDCILTNASCFETYKMLLRALLRAFCILLIGGKLAYHLPPDYFISSPKITAKGKHIVGCF
jgi:hypothetical protein